MSVYVHFSPLCLSVSVRFWELNIKCKEQNCIIRFLIMQLSNRGLLTTVALNDCFEALVVSRHLLVYSLLRQCQ